MLSSPKDTLAFHQSRVLCQHRDMSATPCAAVAAALKTFKSNDQNSSIQPEREALWFYGMNHVVAMISANRAPLEPLPKPEWQLVEDYHTLMNEKAVRAFYYLLIVCIRESRHNQSKSASKPKIAEKFGEPVANFFCTSGYDEGSIHQQFLNNPPLAKIGDLTGAMQWAFYHSKWAGGYGGKKWGSIADCLHRFVTGEYSAEMMLDTIWTLQHNGGVLFNKGHFYGYETPTLKRILDIQRSGQIPTAICHDKAIAGFVSDELMVKIQLAEKVRPGTVKPFVDWFMVEALGSVHKYPKEIAAQTGAHGLSPEASAAQKLQAEKLAAKMKAAVEAKVEYEKTHFKVMSGVTVKKVEVRTAQAA